MSIRTRSRSLSPEEFRHAIDALFERSSEELLESQQRLADLRPHRSDRASLQAAA